jgi:hypothetical protein
VVGREPRTVEEEAWAWVVGMQLGIRTVKTVEEALGEDRIGTYMD